MDRAEEGQDLDVVVRDVVKASADTLLIRVEAANGEPLPAYRPGAHVAVHCADAGVRHYSLTGPDAQQYLLGVKLAADTRGGSRWLFDNARPGRSLRISSPRDHFPLVEAQAPYLFLSGGIGATPIVAMLYALRGRGVRARWVHMCRTRDDLAFGEWMADLGGFHDVHLHVDAAANGPYDLAAEMRGAPAESLVYCCGPAGMMQAVRDLGAELGRSDRCHFEFFSAPAQDAAHDAGEFTVVQSSTGRRIPVPKTKTMLLALREAGIEVKSECEYGVCGWCAVGVLDGTPQHFDSYLTDAEKDANQLVLPCVSRCASATLTLDI